MRKILFAIVVSLLGVACSSNLDEEVTNISSSMYPDLTAGFETETRTYVENDKYLRWHEDDRLTVFFGNTLNNQYKFKGKTGDNSGTFSLVPSGELGTGNSLDNIYGIYPYNASATITDAGIITYSLPATQQYAENSFGKNANTMVAVTNGVEDTFLSFKNACGYLVLKLYGNATIKNVEVKGNFEEKIAGNATITAGYGENPIVTMNNNATSSINVDCGTGVTIGTTSENATAFWVVIPETTFNYGITITVTDVNGKVFTKSTNNKIVIERNAIMPMKALEFVGESGEITPISNSTITYTTDDGNIVDLFTTEGFGANITSNNYDQVNNIGTITFNGEINTIPAEAFQVCTNLTSVQLPNSITTIAEKAFYGCNYMKKIIIPESVETIGANAFSNCTGEAIIQCEIGNNAFEGASFSKVTVTNTITGKEAFMDCANLKTVELPNGLTTIPYCTFQNSGLEKITIPGTVETIEDGAFYECTKLKSIALPESVNVLGESTFQKCSSLQEIKMPSTMTSIGPSSFRDCSALIECTIPEGVTTLEPYMFYDCGNLTTLTLPSTLKSMSGSFFRCNELTRLNISDLKAWLKIEPQSVEGYLGGESPFDFSKAGSIYVDGELLTDLVIPNDIIDIRQAAFLGVTSLKSVTFGSRVSTIGDEAFRYCSNIQNFTFPKSLASCGRSAFAGTGITEITVTPALVADAVFRDCKKLTKVVIGEGVTNIAGYMFYGCSALSDITLPNSITAIDECAFMDCSGLTTIPFPESLTTIGLQAFGGCTSLKEVTIPSKVTTIARSIFAGCTNLTTVNLHSKIETLGMEAFSGCSKLCNVELPASLTSIGYAAFQNCSNLQSINIPNGITQIEQNTFEKSGLVQVTLPESLKTIETGAFSYCPNLITITIPASVTMLENYAFNGKCKNVYFSSQIPPTIGASTFSWSDGTDVTSIYVPSGVIEDYKNASVFKDHTDLIIGYTPTE